jgi:SWI/SNF-related matrix-associated actin-dependent regulator 1 of chromatin subfamily A
MELYPHQKETLEFIEKTNGRALVALDPGLGKTAISVMYLERQQMYPALVVCPSSVKGVWQREFKAWTGRDSLIVNGRALYEGEVEEPLTIINYDILASQYDWLVEQNFKCIVFDEAHALQNPDTAWTKAAIALAKRCPRVQGLSGTPVANRPKDFWAILHIIRPDLFPSFNKFAWEYCAPKFIDSQGRWDYTGAANLDKLHASISLFMIRRKKEILDLPEQSIRMETVAIDNREIYQALHSEYVKTARSPFLRFANQGANKLSLTTQMLTATARGKARAVVEWLQQAITNRPGEKLIVFCTHTGMLDVIHRRVAPGRSLFIDGSVSGKKRTQIVAQFESDPEIDLIVCNIVAAGAGITLNAATRTVFVELPWSPRHILQAKDRNYRIGQLNATEVIYLVAENTIEEKLCRILQEKSNIADAIVDGKKQGNMNVLDMLQSAMMETR